MIPYGPLDINRSYTRPLEKIEQSKKQFDKFMKKSKAEVAKALKELEALIKENDKWIVK